MFLGEWKWWRRNKDVPLPSHAVLSIAIVCEGKSTFPLLALLLLLRLQQYKRVCFMYSSNYRKYYNVLLSFFSSSSNNFLFLFSEVIDKCYSIFIVVTQKSWGNHRLNAFKFTEMAHSNRTLSMILLNYAKYVHILTFISTSLSPFTQQV